MSLYLGFAAISNIDKVLSVNFCANVLVLEDFNIHYKDWLTYSDGTDRLGELSLISLSQMNLFRWLNFLLRCLPLILSLVLQDWFISSNPDIYSTVAFTPKGSSDHTDVSVSTEIPSNSEIAPFHLTAYDYSCADWDGYLDARICSNLVNLLLQNVVSGFRVGMMYISHNHQYQAKLLSSLVLATCGAAIAHENLFFLFVPIE